ncbi:glycoside hydrolase superfamily [Tricladium varicosporioides]|nr:glycoside hydrolase superfamily [Hymenoscyphus varicosporioides]
MNLLRISALLQAAVLAAAKPRHVVSKNVEVRDAQAAVAITVDPTKQYQPIDGFGFSEAFQRANTIVNLPADKQRKALDLLFNRTSGAGMTILRIGIGSSPDSSSDHMNTILPKSPGSPTGTPNYVWDGKDSGQLFVAKEAMKYGVETFYADAWSAPGFMKTNGNEANGGTLCGVTGAKCSSGDWRQAYANYLVRYVQYYLEAGVKITHLGFLNEPELSTSYASMLSSGAQAADFIKVLHPTLEAANLSYIKIACCDAEGWGDQKSMTSALSSVNSMLGLITGHAYTSQPTSPISTPHHVWQTEWADLQGAWTAAWYGSGGAGEGMTWANRIHDGLTTANCSGYLYWVGAQGGSTNSKLMKIENGVITPSKRLWAYGQYARAAQPGAIRIGVSGGSMKTTAFKNEDGSIAVLMINSGSATTVSISVGGGFKGTGVSAYLTDNSHDCDETPATIKDGVVSGDVPSRGMVSFIISAS